VESLEARATVLLVDEDTSATNFMIRDRRMQALVAKDAEPITPFVDRIRELRDRLAVSTVLVMGGCGDYLDHADTVIQMDSYRARDLTDAAHEVARSHPTERAEELERELARFRPRRLDPQSLNPERKSGRLKIQARGVDTLLFGRTAVDLRGVDQLVDASQVRTIGWLLASLSQRGAKRLDPGAAISELLERLAAGDWSWLSGRPDGDLAQPRLHEVMAALNRIHGVILD